MATYTFKPVPVWGSVGRTVRLGGAAGATYPVTDPSGAPVTVNETGKTYVTADANGLLPTFHTTDVPTVLIQLAPGVTVKSDSVEAVAGAASYASAAATSATNAASSASAAASSAASAGNKVPKDTLVINVKDHGAVGDGTTDDASAIRSAITVATATPNAVVFFPPATRYRVASTIDVPSDLRLFASGPTAIYGDTTASVIRFNSGSGQRLDGLTIASQAGHVLEVVSAYNFHLESCHLIQYAAGKSVVYHNGSGSFIDATFDHCTFDAPPGATVPPISLTNSGNGLNSTRWENSRLNGNSTMTVPFIRMRNTGGSGVWAHDHTFSRLTAEVCPAGILWASSTFGVVVDQVAPWDVSNYTADLFKFDTDVTAGSTYTRNAVVMHSGRRGGTISAGFYDVNFDSASAGVAAMFMLPTTSGEFRAKVNLPADHGMVIGCGGPFIQYSYGGSLKLPVPATGDRPAASDAGVGAMLYDSTLGKPIWSNGSVWKDSTGTTV